ncbi:UNVERIFIED_CONTAM: epsB [Trichonephila clavipes]
MTKNGQHEEVDLREIVGTLIAGRWIIAGVSALTLALGVLYTKVAIPIYQVNSLVQVEDSGSGGLGAVTSQLGDLFEGKTIASAEMQLIRSRMVLGRTVTELGLEMSVTPEVFPVIGRLWEDTNARLDVGRFSIPDNILGSPFQLVLLENGYKLYGPDGVLIGKGNVGHALQGTWNGMPIGIYVRQAVGKPGQTFNLVKHPYSVAIGRVDAQIGLSEMGKQTGIIQLTYDHPDPVLAVKILNHIVNSYIRQNVERKSAEAASTLAFVESQLPEIKATLEASEVRFNDYRRQTGSVDISQESQLLLQQTVQNDTSLLGLQQRRKELLTRFTAEHPSVKALDSQIGSLLNQQRLYGGDITRLPATQQELLRLTRDLQVNQGLYTTLLNNAQQLKVVRGGAVGNARVVDVALPPLQPISPRKPLIVLLSLFFGVILGTAIVFVRHALKSGIKDPGLIESKLGLSVLATIPASAEQEKLYKLIGKKSQSLNVLAHKSPEDLSIESLRSLRTSMSFAFLDAKNNIIMITGPSPQVGKSFVSVNLAAVIASAGKRVLLIDGDMRRGYLNEYLGQARDGGLSDLIAGQQETNAVIRPTGIPGFDFVSTGVLPPNPSELLLHPNFEAILSKLSDSYDHVLIDSPPVMAVTDAAIIGRLVGATLVLARFAVTPLNEIEQSVRRLEQAGVKVNGVILNDVEISQGYNYGYKYAYAYHYERRSD